MRPEAVRQALLENEGRPSTLHPNDGSRLSVRSREHWMFGPGFLYVRVGAALHRVSFRNIASIAVDDRPAKKRGRRTG